MNEMWQRGLLAYQRGNFFAARDIWSDALCLVESSQDRAIILNGLGSVLHRVRGEKAARSYFESSVNLATSLNMDVGFRMKSMSNLSQILCQLDYQDAGLKLASEACSLVTEDLPQESLFALQASVFTKTSAELYRDVLDMEAQVLRILDLFSDQQAIAYQRSLFYHNLGHSALELDLKSRALIYFHESLNHYRFPESLLALAEEALWAGQAATALSYASDVYDDLYGFSVTGEKRLLAHSLKLLSALAYFDGQENLYRRCLEKAELYFGQVLSWPLWLKMREFGRQLTVEHVQLPTNAIRWDIWQAFLDDLNLMDGLESTFPTLFQVSRLAADYAERIARQLPVPPSPEAIRQLRMAGRLMYLGLTVLHEEDAQAIQSFQDDHGHDQMIEYGLRVLEAYHHAEPYRVIISASGRSAGGDYGLAHSEDSLMMAQCLRMARNYVELIEVHNLQHGRAVCTVLDNAHREGVAPEVSAAFETLFCSA